MSVLIVGLLLGGTYALMAMGLQLQYGVARVMNLANGEVIVAGAFATFWFFAGSQMSPFLSIVGVVPAAFAVNWAVYRILILPLVRRAKSQGQLDVDSILATFGLSFIFIGVLLTVFGGEMLTYSYLARPFVIFGEPYALNRIAAFLGSAILCACLYVLAALDPRRAFAARGRRQPGGGRAGQHQCRAHLGAGVRARRRGERGGRLAAQHVPDIRRLAWA